ncbi:hypothetical protein D9757_008662 [Collybiopsis confluens]|uniref:Uncharacterized protein n=1 Tax=Collybiopsis confluens TaxID=2823264 RepID=A0A8H5H4M0_9AGAR|nr:hypothetical protein D9757_008662 [Collybiopsis confluens]
MVDPFTAVTGSAQIGSSALDVSNAILPASSKKMLKDIGDQVDRILDVLEKMEPLIERFGREDHKYLFQDLVSRAKMNSETLNDHTLEARKKKKNLLSWFSLWVALRRLHGAVTRNIQEIEGASRALRAKVLESKYPRGVTSQEIDEAWILWDHISICEDFDESELKPGGGTFDCNEGVPKGKSPSMEAFDLKSNSVALNVLDYTYPPTPRAGAAQAGSNVTRNNGASGISIQTLRKGILRR